MDVLLTCAGRRNYLVRYFQEALAGRGKVFAADASASAPALQEADGFFVLPTIEQEEYLNILLELCQKHQIGLLVSLNDLELPLIARQRARFDAIGTLPIISSPEVIETCFDKWASLHFLVRAGFQVPKTYLSLQDARQALSRGEVEFPLVIKPRWGAASIGVELIQDLEELELAYRLIAKRLPRSILARASERDRKHALLIQEWLDGNEYGVDVVNDLEGRYVATFAKRKLVMRAGETDRAVTVRSDALEGLGATLGECLKHVGNLDCDIIANESGRWVLEMNPRFGGGYPFSHVAGANLPRALLAWVEGEQPHSGWLSVTPDVVSSKYDHLIIIDKRVSPDEL
jgi:carbamoyl-phosphate synthase large subunit